MLLLFSIPLRKTFFSKARDHDSFSRSFHLAKQIYLQLGTVKLSRWRHWLNFIETNGAAPRAAKSVLQRSRLYWQLHQLWKSFELHERSKLDELARAVMIGRVIIAIFYHFLISVFSLFHWELCTALNPHSTLANSQHQHQATSLLKTRRRSSSL